jgi:dynein heavy chain
MRALRDFNMPKIVTDDKSIFLNLINDLFPRLNPPVKMDVNFGGAAKETCKVKMGYDPYDPFLLKVV